MDSYLSSAVIIADGTMLLGTLLAAAALRRGLMISELLRGGGAPRLPGTKVSLAGLALESRFDVLESLVIANVFRISGNRVLVTVSKVVGDIRLTPNACMLPPRGT